ncbi:hypothetical protein LH464_10390 [Neorhizobium sp. T786]|uniref:hypothetical protein n=1 Tax=Pseudorhizobium xiangyangii TaxID=2883104 RepID=UPI001CFFC7AC|nr:hypothetical protein [Neorhizobium xiangyangii]MCB5202878.1 hypothetical protein [Neorhizobium xiangyangii]
MTKSLTSTFAAALIASAAFGSAALASGDYYQGADAQPAASVDIFQTSSVGERSIQRDGVSVQVANQAVDRGDYYEGANRPN